MQLHVIASGSRGNCYILENENEALVIELGVRFSDIKQALSFNLSKVVGAIVSHEHGDHSKAVKNALAAGIDVYLSPGTQNALKVSGHRVKNISHRQAVKIGNFEVMAFDVKHDVPEPLGFLIKHPDCGTTCFITDSFYCKYAFPDLDHVIVEANYCEKILDDLVIAGVIPHFRYDRTITSHMSIQNCKLFLEMNDLTKVKNILLVHLSEQNSNAAQFKTEIEDFTGKNVNIAQKGLKLNWGKNPF